MNVTASNQHNPAAVVPRGKEAPRPDGASGNVLPLPGKSAPVARPASPPISIDKALEQIQAYLSDSKRQLDFQFDESTGHMIIKVMDPVSGEVIRQMPSEEVIKLAALLDSQGWHTLNELA